MLNDEQADNLITILASVDHFHTVKDQDKAREKAQTWKDVLGDVDYDACKHAITAHYLHQGAKSMTPGVLRSLAQSFTAAQERQMPVYGSPEDDARRERSCKIEGCLCTHTVCFAGFLDEEVITRRNGMEYTAVQRCPQCKEALDARTGAFA